MAKIYYDQDADLSLMEGTTVAVVGYGSQGHAHAQNLRDSGVDVIVAELPGTANYERAKADGFEPVSAAEAAEKGDVVILLLPDTIQPKVYHAEIEPHMKKGKTLMFAHGFNIQFEQIVPPDSVDVSMIAPKGPGHRVRELYIEGVGIPGLLAVEQDASGKAKENALAYARALGCTKAGVIETTFTEETETDLFGEQVVLCGGVTHLVETAFDVLVEAGYQPEIAYFEVMHELKLIVDLLYQGGMSYMRYSISDTAEHGDYTGGPRIITDETRKEMKKMLKEIQDGTYAMAWIEENKKGRPWFNEQRKKARGSQIEQVGKKLRAMMPWLNPKVVEELE